MIGRSASKNVSLPHIHIKLEDTQKKTIKKQINGNVTKVIGSHITI